MLVPDAGTSTSTDLFNLIISVQIDRLERHLESSKLSLSMDDRQPVTPKKGVNALEQFTS
jgi:hypothetical protein